MMHRYGYAGLWMLPMMFICIIIIIAAVVLVVKFTGNGRNKTRSFENSGAMDILNERFARGEIDEEEYQRKKQLLNGK